MFSLNSTSDGQTMNNASFIVTRFSLHFFIFISDTRSLTHTHTPANTHSRTHTHTMCSKKNRSRFHVYPCPRLNDYGDYGDDNDSVIVSVILSEVTCRQMFGQLSRGDVPASQRRKENIWCTKFDHHSSHLADNRKAKREKK